MNTLKFKTNIKCSGCIAAATSVLNEVIGKNNWTVDTSVPEKTLTVNAGESIDEQDVIIAVNEAGYTAEKIDGKIS